VRWIFTFIYFFLLICIKYSRRVLE